MERHKVHTVEYALIDDNKVKSVNTITDQDITSEAPPLFQAASFSKSITNAQWSIWLLYINSIRFTVNDYLKS